MMQLREGGEDIDVDYWETVLRELQLARARTLVRQVYEGIVQKRLALIGGRQVESQVEPKETSEQAAAAESGAASSRDGEPGRLSPQLFAEDEVSRSCVQVTVQVYARAVSGVSARESLLVCERAC